MLLPQDNEAIHDLLCPPSSALMHAPINIQGTGNNVILTPLREEVVTSLKGVKEVLERGYGNRRTASTDWNERSSRSHSVFRVVIKSRERGSGEETGGRATPSVPPTPSGSKLQARGGRSVQTWVLVSATPDICHFVILTPRLEFDRSRWVGEGHVRQGSNTRGQIH